MKEELIELNKNLNEKLLAAKTPTDLSNIIDFLKKSLKTIFKLSEEISSLSCLVMKVYEQLLAQKDLAGLNQLILLKFFVNFLSEIHPVGLLSQTLFLLGRSKRWSEIHQFLSLSPVRVRLAVHPDKIYHYPQIVVQILHGVFDELNKVAPLKLFSDDYGRPDWRAEYQAKVEEEAMQGSKVTFMQALLFDDEENFPINSSVEILPNDPELTATDQEVLKTMFDSIGLDRQAELQAEKLAIYAWVSKNIAVVNMEFANIEMRSQVILMFGAVIAHDLKVIEILSKLHLSTITVKLVFPEDFVFVGTALSLALYLEQYDVVVMLLTSERTAIPNYFFTNPFLRAVTNLFSLKMVLQYLFLHTTEEAGENFIDCMSKLALAAWPPDPIQSCFFQTPANRMSIDFCRTDERRALALFEPAIRSILSQDPRFSFLSHLVHRGEEHALFTDAWVFRMLHASFDPVFQLLEDAKKEEIAQQREVHFFAVILNIFKEQDIDFLKICLSLTNFKLSNLNRQRGLTLIEVLLDYCFSARSEEMHLHRRKIQNTLIAFLRDKFSRDGQTEENIEKFWYIIARNLCMTGRRDKCRIKFSATGSVVYTIPPAAVVFVKRIYNAIMFNVESRDFLLCCFQLIYSLNSQRSRSQYLANFMTCFFMFCQSVNILWDISNNVNEFSGLVIEMANFYSGVFPIKELRVVSERMKQFASRLQNERPQSYAEYTSLTRLEILITALYVTKFCEGTVCFMLKEQSLWNLGIVLENLSIELQEFISKFKNGEPLELQSPIPTTKEAYEMREIGQLKTGLEQKPSPSSPAPSGLGINALFSKTVNVFEGEEPDSDAGDQSAEAHRYLGQSTTHP